MEAIIRGWTLIMVSYFSLDLRWDKVLFWLVQGCQLNIGMLINLWIKRLNADRILGEEKSEKSFCVKKMIKITGENYEEKWNITIKVHKFQREE